MQKLFPDLFMLTLGGVHVYLMSSDDGLILIDTGNTGDEDDILQALRAAGHQATDVRHIIVTHCHADHAGSLAALQVATGAQVSMHPLDAALVRIGQAVRSTTHATPGLINRIIFQTIIKTTPATITPAHVDHEINDGDMLPLAGGIEVIHAPGHSLGMVVLRWQRHGGVLFAADAAINILAPALFPAYEDRDEGRRSLAKLAAKEYQMVTCSHGRLLRGSAVGRFRRRWAAEPSPAAIPFPPTK